MANLKIGLVLDEIHPLLTAIERRVGAAGHCCDFLSWKNLGSATLNSYDAIYLDRMGESCFSYATQIFLLEKHRSKMPNGPLEYYRARDKALTSEHFWANGVGHPKTSYAFCVETTMAQISDGPELQLLKSIQGFCAKEVVPFRKDAIPENFLKSILVRDGMILRQDFVEGAKDYIWRIDIVAGKIVVANQRHKFNSDGPAICNGTHGGRVDFWRPEEVPQPIVQLALRSAEVMGLQVAGVDILEGKNGIYVLEVNPEPDITLDRYEFPEAIADLLMDIGEKRLS